MLVIKKWLTLLFIIVAIALLCVIYGYQQIQQALQQTVRIERPLIFVVEQGQNVNGLTRTLAKHNRITTSIWLKFAFKLSPQLTKIQAGTYELQPDMTLEQSLELFVSGKEKVFTISLIEGLRWQDWIETLNNTEYLRPSDKTTQQWITWLDPELQGNSLEGWLMPDSYHFTANDSAEDIVQLAFDTMKIFLEQQWQNRAIGLPYDSAYEALIMASIVEKETAVASERPHIAGVFVNRLLKNMRLQTDPTVIYGMGNAFDGNIRRKDLRQKTPYNTYVIKGLPPTPIAMAGREAIQAALHPMVTEDLYFVAKGDGSHAFSQTLEQHNAAVRKYQLKQ